VTLLADVVRASSRVAGTASRLAKTAEIAACLRRVDPAEIAADARESARQSTCMSNMHQLYVAASQYKTDNQDYPNMLLGYAERPDGFPWDPADSPTPVDAARLQHGPLFRAYINDINVFQCPDNPNRDKIATTVASFPPSSPRAPLQPTLADFKYNIPSVPIDYYNTRKL